MFFPYKVQPDPAILLCGNLEQKGLASPVPSRVIFEEKPLSPLSVVVKQLGLRHPVSHGRAWTLGRRGWRGEVRICSDEKGGWGGLPQRLDEL